MRKSRTDPLLGATNGIVAGVPSHGDRDFVIASAAINQKEETPFQRVLVQLSLEHDAEVLRLKAANYALTKQVDELRIAVTDGNGDDADEPDHKPRRRSSRASTAPSTPRSSFNCCNGEAHEDSNGSSVPQASTAMLTTVRIGKQEPSEKPMIAEDTPRAGTSKGGGGNEALGLEQVKLTPASLPGAALTGLPEHNEDTMQSLQPGSQQTTLQELSPKVSGMEGEGFRIRKAYTETEQPSPTHSSLIVVRKQLLHRSQSLLGIEEVAEVSSSSRWLIAHPGSPQRFAWDIAGATLIASDFLLLPLRAFDLPESLFLDFMGWITLIYWTLNVPASLTVGFVKDGVTIMQPSKIVCNYIKSWLLIDLLCLAPDWFFTIADMMETGGQRDSTADTLRMLRVLRFVRTVRLVRLMKLQIILNRINDLLDSEYSSIFFNIGKMILILVLINHIIACGWFSITNANNQADSWVREYGFENEPWATQYAVAFHWSITQFTPASMHVQPQNVKERTFSILIVIFGLIAFSYLVGSITSSLAQLRAMQETSARQFWTLRRFLKQHKVSMQLSLRINKYVEHALLQQRSRISESNVEMLSLLSDQLRNELKCEMTLPLTTLHPLFFHLNSLSDVSMRKIATTAIMQKNLAMGDSLFYPGEAGTHMYFVANGKMSYQKPMEAGEILNQKEHWISEATLWTASWMHVGLLLSLTECELMVIDPVKFGEAVITPEVVEMVVQYAETYCSWLASQAELERTDVANAVLHEQFNLVPTPVTHSAEDNLGAE